MASLNTSLQYLLTLADINSYQWLLFRVIKYFYRRKNIYDNNDFILIDF